MLLMYSRDLLINDDQDDDEVANHQNNLLGLSEKLNKLDQESKGDIKMKESGQVDFEAFYQRILDRRIS